MVSSAQVSKKFSEFTEICRQIEKISSLLEMKSTISDFLKKLNGEDLEIATRFLMGKIFPEERDLGIGQGLLNSALSAVSGESIETIKELLKKTGDIGLAAKEAIFKKAKKKQTTFNSFAIDAQGLTIVEVYKHLENISRATGSGSQNKKIKILQYLFNSASPEEAVYLARLIMQELRIGVGEGVMRDAIAQAFNVGQDQIERAYMFTGDLGLIARIARDEGNSGLEKLNVVLFRPVKMMLAQLAREISSAIEEMDGVAAVEWKYDGARVQIHKQGEKVAIYSRKLEDVTSSLPDVVELLKSIDAKEVILDGEVIAIASNGKPRPFQDILKRFRRKFDVLEMAAQIPLSLKLFDILYIDGRSLIDLSLRERRKILENILRASSREISIAEQFITSSKEEVEKIYTEAIAAGHEGIMLKDLNSKYTPGKRGRHWLKLKRESETLDLVVIGAEWGEGKRAHLLGSYLLACRDPNTGELLSIGKVGTGMSDEMLADLTEIFKELIIPKGKGKEVAVKPVIVFEVGYEEIQKSPNYASGYALRFPRLVNIRYDKTAEEADTLDKVEQIYLLQRYTRGTQI
ncbi:MAG: ATP-dependent DNA ligase [Methanocellales archaeon]